MVPLLPGLSWAPSWLPTTAVVHDLPLCGVGMAPAPGCWCWSDWKIKVLMGKQTPGLPGGEQPKTGLSRISPTAPPAPRLHWGSHGGRWSQPARAAPCWFGLPRAELYPPPRSLQRGPWGTPQAWRLLQTLAVAPRHLPSPLALPVPRHKPSSAPGFAGQVLDGAVRSLLRKPWWSTAWSSGPGHPSPGMLNVSPIPMVPAGTICQTELGPSWKPVH